jgi:hypothetical protein
MTPIVRIKFGSHLYGTSTPQSDVDFKSIHIPSSNDILLQQVQDSIKTTSREKVEGEKNLPGDVDDESFSLQRYLSLLAEGQTVALDMLFAPDESLVYSSPLWDVIRRNKDMLLTKNSAAFLGYCHQQANKYGIKGSRVAAARDATFAFQHAYENHGATARVGDFIPIMVALRNSNPEHIKFTEKVIKSRVDKVETYFVCCNRMVPFTASVKLAAEMCTRIHTEYGDRARKAERNEGVDWKALSHAVRVGNEALELLTTKFITFPRPEAAHLLDIKQGRLPYKQVSEEIERLLVAVEAAAVTSTLPSEVDRLFMDNLVCNVYRAEVYSQ